MKKEKKEIMLIANYWHFESEKVSSRYRSFANIISEKYQLEVVTSTFCHLKKEQRTCMQKEINNLPYKMTMLYEKGYKKNISLKRIFSYEQFGRNVYRYLKSRKIPDLIIISVPSLSVADYVTRYANEKKIPVIVDIQDLWPEAFKMAIDIPVISDILFYPMKKQAQRIYSRADTVMAVSNTYVNHGKKCNPNARGLSIYIGTDSKLAKEKMEAISIEKKEDEFWIGYVGALGHSYDLKSVICALEELQKCGYNNIVFKVMGDGVLKEEFSQFAIEHGVKCDFTGLLDYGTMMKVLSRCDVAVNPIVGKSVSSIINKVSDYAMAEVPVVNTQNSKEYRKLLEEYQAGINVENGNIQEMADAIALIYNNSELRRRMSYQSKSMFEECFERCKTYPKLIDEIKQYIE